MADANTIRIELLSATLVVAALCLVAQSSLQVLPRCLTVRPGEVNYRQSRLFTLLLSLKFRQRWSPYLLVQLKVKSQRRHERAPVIAWRTGPTFLCLSDINFSLMLKGKIAITNAKSYSDLVMFSRKPNRWTRPKGGTWCRTRGQGALYSHGACRPSGWRGVTPCD